MSDRNSPTSMNEDDLNSGQKKFRPKRKRIARTDSPRSENESGETFEHKTGSTDVDAGGSGSFYDRRGRYGDNEERNYSRRPSSGAEGNDRPYRAGEYRGGGNSSSSYQKNNTDRPQRDSYRRNDGDRPQHNSYRRDDGYRPQNDSYRRNDGDRPQRDSYRRNDGDRPQRDSYRRNDGGGLRKPFDKNRDSNFRGTKKPFGKKPKLEPFSKEDYKKKKALAHPAPHSFEREPENDTIRLNKFIANSGICSRREADDLITAGLISVNGKVITELGTKINLSDMVRYNNEIVKNERLVYLLLNKPKDFITTMDDPEQRHTVMQLVASACKERIYPVGRLDRNTTGLLLFTNDGEMAKKLTHPSSEIRKVYHVELDKNLSPQDMELISKGVELEDGIAEVDDIAYDGAFDKRSHVGVELHSGKNRIVRRIFEKIGYDVKKLDRVVFAGLDKKDLPRGKWRFLEDTEVNHLRTLTSEKKKKTTRTKKTKTE
ncbi:MAG TPA: pseudouridine synthase [Bacteroidia bacterium]|nr:pseudouridine synthase [Bacteroidia bacterium]HNU32246.1 pseudouridine synthase [Bacteroidia bacterium]